MKEERESQEHVQAEGTRRKFLHFIGVAATLPSVAFLEGCTTTPPSTGGAKGGMRGDPLKGGPQVKPKKIKDFSKANTVPKQIKWDFDRLIVNLERYLEKKDKNDEKAKKKYAYKKNGKKKKWKLKIDPPRNNRDRMVVVEVTSLEFKPAGNDKTKIGKMRIRGRMLRNRNGTPYDKNFNLASRRKGEIVPYYSSSLSSWSSWA